MLFIVQHGSLTHGALMQCRTLPTVVVNPDAVSQCESVQGLNQLAKSVLGVPDNIVSGTVSWYCCQLSQSKSHRKALRHTCC